MILSKIVSKIEIIQKLLSQRWNSLFVAILVHGINQIKFAKTESKDLFELMLSSV